MLMETFELGTVMRRVVPPGNRKVWVLLMTFVNGEKCLTLSQNPGHLICAGAEGQLGGIRRGDDRGGDGRRHGDLAQTHSARVGRYHHPERPRAKTL